jgi:hypothetical protein
MDYSYKLRLIEERKQNEIRILGESPNFQSCGIDENQIEDFINKTSRKIIYLETILIILLSIYIFLLVLFSLEEKESFVFFLFIPAISFFSFSFDYLSKYKKKAINRKFPTYEKYKADLSSYIKKRNDIKIKYEILIKDLEKQHKIFWVNLSGIEFEKNVESLFTKLGFFVKRTSYRNDKGIDLIIEKENTRYIVQCKAHKNRLTPSIIRDLFGTFSSGKYDGAILVSISEFSRGIHEFVSDKPLMLIDVDDITELNKDNKINYWNNLKSKYDFK